jgi:hypothetical protein
MKVFIVTAAWGEYEDRTEEVIGVYSNKKTANLIVANMKEEFARRGKLPCPKDCTKDGPSVDYHDRRYDDLFKKWQHWMNAQYWKDGGIYYDVKDFEVDKLRGVITKACNMIMDW